jgi:hypothetical protein
MDFVFVSDDIRLFGYYQVKNSVDIDLPIRIIFKYLSQLASAFMGSDIGELTHFSRI